MTFIEMVGKIWVLTHHTPYPDELRERAIRCEELCALLEGAMASRQAAALIVMQFERDREIMDMMHKLSS